MKQEEKKHYVSPQLTVVTFKTERGYLASGNKSLFTTLAISSAFQSEGYQNLEDRGATDSWSWQ